MDQHRPSDEETRASATEGDESQDAPSADTTCPTFGIDSLTRSTGAPRGVHASGPPPDLFAGYTITREIHHGGQGVVYEAQQHSPRRKVAIKVMRTGPFARSADRARFEAEVDVLGQLKHPNVVTIYEGGTVGGQCYFAMEYVDGVPVDEYVAREKLTIGQTLRLMARICGAVEYAHLKNVVHLDLKPGNILIDRDGEPRVVDFGLAKVTGGGLVGGPGTIQAGEGFLGTPAYASPEQTRGDPGQVDRRSDVYSLGMVLYQLLTGCFPYSVKDGWAQTLDNIVHATAKKPSDVNRKLEGEVDAILLKALAKDPAARYQSAAELGGDIERYLAGEPIGVWRDRVGYVVKRRGRTLLRKHPVPANFGVVVLAALLASLLGGQFVFVLTPINEWFEQLLGIWPISSAANPAMSSVRVIAIEDGDELERLARREQVPGVTVDEWRSMRRLHGRLMEKLARAGPRVVAWDITFDGETPYDQDFVRGVHALRSAGVDVVVAVGRWCLDGRLPTSRTIAPEVRWGAVTGGFNQDQPWQLDLAVQRGHQDPLPSLALLASTAGRYPGAELSLRLDGRAQCVEARCWTWKGDPASRIKEWRGPAERSVVTFVKPPGHAPHPQFGLLPTDAVAYYYLDVPSDEVLSGATLSYQDVCEVDADQLRDWLADKYVVIGDCRPGVDAYDHPDGRRVSGCYAHAVAIAALLQQSSIRAAWGRTETIGLFVIGAVLGLVVANVAKKSLAWRCALVGVIAVVGVGLSLVAYQEFHYIYNPAVAIIALMMACVLGSAVNRAREVRVE